MLKVILRKYLYVITITLLVVCNMTVNLVIKGDAFARIGAIPVGAYACYLISSFYLKHTMQIGYRAVEYKEQNKSDREFGFIIGWGLLIFVIVDSFVISYF